MTEAASYGAQERRGRAVPKTDALYVGMIEVGGTKIEVFALVKGVRLKVTARVKVGFFRKTMCRSFDLTPDLAKRAVALILDALRQRPANCRLDVGTLVREPQAPARGPE